MFFLIAGAAASFAAYVILAFLVGFAALPFALHSNTLDLRAVILSPLLQAFACGVGYAACFYSADWRMIGAGPLLVSRTRHG